MANLAIYAFALVCLRFLIPAHALQCTSCQKLSHIEPRCLNETCPPGMDRCLFMTFTATNTALGTTHGMWVKGCNKQNFCNSKHSCATMATMLSTVLSGMKKCKIACSISNNVQIPTSGGGNTSNIVQILSTTTSTPKNGGGTPQSGGGNAGVPTCVNIIAALHLLFASLVYVFI